MTNPTKTKVKDRKATGVTPPEQPATSIAPTNTSPVASKLLAKLGKQDVVAQWKQPTPLRDYILLDSSGSMTSKWKDALNAVNGYVHALGSKVPTRILLSTFADDYTELRQEVSPLTWKNLTEEVITPEGSTALNDAIGRIVAQAKRDNPEKAAIVIATDGEENASRELTTAQANALLEECRNRGWQVIHLHIGSQTTAQTMSDAYGINANQTIAASKEKLGITLQKVAEKRQAYAKSGLTFTETEKKTHGGRYRRYRRYIHGSLCRWWN